MPHGSVSVIIPACSSDVFDLLHDYDRRLSWDTMLSAAYLADGNTAAGLGATCVCRGRGTLGGIVLKSVYVAYDRPRLAAVKMVNRPLWFDTWAASIRHEDLGPGQSQVTYTWTFTARPRWLAWLVEPMMNAIFRWETRKRLEALRDHLVASSSHAADERR